MRRLILLPVLVLVPVVVVAVVVVLVLFLHHLDVDTETVLLRPPYIYAVSGGVWWIVVLRLEVTGIRHGRSN
jgi:hypothetical protein